MVSSDTTTGVTPRGGRSRAEHPHARTTTTMATANITRLHVRIRMPRSCHTPLPPASTTRAERFELPCPSFSARSRGARGKFMQMGAWGKQSTAPPEGSRDEADFRQEACSSPAHEASHLFRLLLPDGARPLSLAYCSGEPPRSGGSTAGSLPIALGSHRGAAALPLALAFVLCEIAFA